MKRFLVVAVLALACWIPAEAADYGSPIPLETRVSELERKVEELERKLADSEKPSPVWKPVEAPKVATPEPVRERFYLVNGQLIPEAQFRGWSAPGPARTFSVGGSVTFGRPVCVSGVCR